MSQGSTGLKSKKPLHTCERGYVSNILVRPASSGDAPRKAGTPSSKELEQITRNFVLKILFVAKVSLGFFLESRD